MHRLFVPTTPVFYPVLGERHLRILKGHGFVGLILVLLSCVMVDVDQGIKGTWWKSPFEGNSRQPKPLSPVGRLSGLFYKYPVQRDFSTAQQICKNVAFLENQESVCLGRRSIVRTSRGTCCLR